MVIDEKDVFVAALALPDAKDREAYLQAACAGHPELYASHEIASKGWAGLLS